MRLLLSVCVFMLLAVLAFAGRDVVPSRKGTVQFNADSLPKTPLIDPKLDFGGFTPGDDFEIDLIASEPAVAQPVHITFDERGRMWVTQYRQYPFPAGVKVVDHDRYWRVVYDKTTPPPPNHFKGKDRVTIFEDTDHDGIYDTSKDFLNDLNICTASLPGNGGVWVMMAPYLLFYPDANQDDVPDRDPVVHLEGFGLEDTHAVASSLAWGPDGWLYGAQGSTCTATVKRPGLDSKGIHFKGHCIWRYHPRTRDFEVFGEGGGNTFSVSFSALGQIFAGSNGSNFGFHYAQGSAFKKNWPKHGPHMNSYSYGYLPKMVETKVERTKLSQPFEVYEGDAYPEKYRGTVFSGRLLTRNVNVAKIKPDGSTFSVEGLPHALTGNSRSFRPVIVKSGPDGCIYLGDWWDVSINHRNTLGRTTSDTGRIYRLRAKGRKAGGDYDLSDKSEEELLELLKHPNLWHRWTARRLLAQKMAEDTLPQLKKWFRDETGQLALEALWTYHQIVGLDEPMRLAAMRHANRWVRLWGVRFVGDRKECTDAESAQLLKMAREEKSAHVRGQLAASLRRLPAKVAIPAIEALLLRSEDYSDPFQPLMLWWAVEKQTQSGDLSGVVKLFEDRRIWSSPTAVQSVLPRLTQKAAETEKRSAAFYSALTQIYHAAPPKQQQAIAAAFSSHYGGTLKALPDGIRDWVKRRRSSLPGGEVAQSLREGDDSGLKKAIADIANRNVSRQVRIELIRAIASHQYPSALKALLKLAGSSGSAQDPKVLAEAIMAVARYDDPAVPAAVKKMLVRPFQDETLRVARHEVLVGRRAWAEDYLTEVVAGNLPQDDSQRLLQKILAYQDESLNEMAFKIWKTARGEDAQVVQEKLNKLLTMVAGGKGDPRQGRLVYRSACAKCHKLGDEGSSTFGPELTPYERGNARYFLSNILAPSAEVREGYSQLVVMMKDGSQHVGVVQEEEGVRMSLATGADKTILINKQEIDELSVSPRSSMPNGLLDTLNDQQIRDLLEFIKSVPAGEVVESLQSDSASASPSP